MIRSLKRLRYIVGRRDGARQAPRRPSPCSPISPTPSSLRLNCCPDDVQQAGAPRYMRPPAAEPQSRQIRKPHSPVHADRGFLHGWLCDAKRHPKPFTISAVRSALLISRKRSGWLQPQVSPWWQCIKLPMLASRSCLGTDQANRASFRVPQADVYIARLKRPPVV